MPKQFIKRFTPDKDKIRRHRHLQMFGNLLHDPNLWHLNRRSVSGAFAVGLFWAMIPMPFQMVAAAATAIPARVNLAISIALVWITNPLTMPPIFYVNYLLGTLLLGKPEQSSHFEMTLEWFKQSMGQVWEPLYLGSVVLGLVLALTGYLSIRGLWRLHIIRHLKQRRLRKRTGST